LGTVSAGGSLFIIGSDVTAASAAGGGNMTTTGTYQADMTLTVNGPQAQILVTAITKAGTDGRTTMDVIPTTPITINGDADGYLR
ncbi:MAG: hypothetical protein HQL52_12255, partial [Magnetococcales bacterium]|nr:hypothetical protein [Magnetococcales bacterium]